MTYKRADFSVKTSDDAIGGAIASAIFPLFGSLASSSMARDNGTKIIESTGIEDPAFTLVDVVQAKTVEKLNPASIRRVTNVEPQGPTFRNMDALRAAAKKGLVLEIATSYWRITYTSLGDSKYYVDYQGRARLYDAESRKLLNESWCYFNSDNEPKTAPTFEKLLADNGALLKKGLDEGMATCGEELSTYLFE